jgi:hypothetical protein
MEPCPAFTVASLYNYALLSSDVSHFTTTPRMDNHHVLHTSLHQQSTNFNTFSFGVKQIINAFSGGHFAFIMQFFIFSPPPNLTMLIFLSKAESKVYCGLRFY